MVTTRRDSFIDDVAKDIAGDKKALDKELGAGLREFLAGRARQRTRRIEKGLEQWEAPPPAVTAEPFFFPEQELPAVSERVTALQPPPFRMPIGELRPPTHYQSGRTRVPAEIATPEQKATWKPIFGEEGLPEPRKGIGFALDVLIARKTTENPKGLTPLEYARQFPASEAAITWIPLITTLGVAAYQGIPSLKALTKQIPDKALQTALNTGLDRWIAQRSRGIPPQSFKQAQGFLYNLLAKDREWLQMRATDNMLRRMGREVNQATAARQAVDDVVADFEARLSALIPRGTQTGAMAFGGKRAGLTPELWNATPVAQRVINAQSVGLSGQVGSKNWEALTAQERQALSGVTQEKPPISKAVPEEVTAPEVTNLPEGWRMEIGKTRTKEGITAESEVDWRRKVIVFRDKESMAKPKIINHEIAHVKIEELPDAIKKPLLDEYVKVANISDWEVKNQFHREKIAIDYGQYLTDASQLKSEVKLFFDRELPKPAIPKAEAAREAIVGRETIAYGPDPNKSYPMRYRLIELDDLIPSHTDAFAPNPAYPKELQPRIRERGVARLAVTKMARDLVPEVLIKDDNTLDRGPMIIGPDNVVESGNGRVMALRQAQQSYPERWQAYQKALQEALPQFGIEQTQLSQMRNPVLVRERISDVDRVQFASEANQPVVAVFSPLENALQDARRIRFDTLVIPEGTQNIDVTLRMAGNRPFVISFLEALPANERASLLDASGELNLLGMQRIKAAMFAATYPGTAGRRLTQIFFESREPLIRNIEEGMLASLPQMARAEGQIQAGNRVPELSIAEDLAKTLDMLAILRQRKLPAKQYLAQRQLFERELTPFQERLLEYTERIANSPRKVREFLGSYADAVLASISPKQTAMMGVVRPTKEDLFNATVRRQEEGPLFATEEREIAAIPTTPAREPGLVAEAPRIPKAPEVELPTIDGVADKIIAGQPLTVEENQLYANEVDAVENAIKIRTKLTIPEVPEAVEKPLAERTPLEMTSAEFNTAYPRLKDLPVEKQQALLDMVNETNLEETGVDEPLDLAPFVQDMGEYRFDLETGGAWTEEHKQIIEEAAKTGQIIAPKVREEYKELISGIEAKKAKAQALREKKRLARGGKPRPEVPAVARPSDVPPAKPPAGATTSPMPEPSPISGRPRTLTDLNREAKGMRALTPEQRAAAMDANKPIAAAELLYQMKPFEEHAKNLLGKDTPIRQAFRNTPGLKQIAGLWTPAQMERADPVAMIGVRKSIFEEIEIARARLAVMRWWHEAEDLFGFKRVAGEMVATKVQPASGVDTKEKWFGRIWDIVEHLSDYVLTAEQSANLKVIQNVFNQNLRDNQRVGVNVVELVDAYWRRIVLAEPSRKRIVLAEPSRKRKGWTRQRQFDDVRELIKAGYKLETDPRIATEDRLESGIRTFSDQATRNAIKQLPGVEKPLERMESRYPQTLEGAKAARAVRDEAKKTFLKSKAIEDEIALRQTEADYITAMREVYIKKIEAGQPNIGELKLPNGRIAPAELVEEVRKWVDLPEIRTTRGAITNPILEVTQLVRTTLTNVDLAAGFIQGQSLFYRNNLAWWRAQGIALVNLVDYPYSYYAKNYQLIDEGIRMGAISLPTEFLFSRRGLASIPTRVPIVGPPMRAFNRAFEGFVVTGQIELFRATRSGALRRATGHITPAGMELEQEAMDALVSLGSAIRKELGTESYAILGVRPTQHTIEQLFLFAARLFRANIGIIGQSFTGGEGGREARRAMGALIAGGLSILIAVSLVKRRKMPNLTDPFAPDWHQVAIGKTYFNPYGPFYPYFRTIARVSVYMAQARHDLAVGELKRFLQSKEGIPFRALDLLAQLGLKGEMRTFEGERIPRTAAGVTKGLLGELAVPISIQEAMEAIPQGRPESAFGEVFGLVGRGSPYNQMDILFQEEKDINPEGQSYRYAEPWQQAEMEKRHPEIAKLLVGRGQGKWADYSQKTAEIDDVFLTQEEELARQFETQKIDPDAFRQRYKEIQIERANQRIGVLKTLELWGYGTKMPKDRDERLQYLMARLPTDDKERALAQYYLNFEIAKDKAGIMDWDILEALQDHYGKRWTQEQREYVERNTGLREHPPLIQEFLEAREELRPYWELPELPRSTRQNYRQTNPEIDALLVKWYGYKPVTGARVLWKAPTEQELREIKERFMGIVRERVEVK